MTPSTAELLGARRPLRDGEAEELALRFASAENELYLQTFGEVDAIIDSDGKTHLLRHAQEQLLRQQRKERAVIESSADVITVVNRGGMIVFQNEAASRVLGYQPELAEGRNIFQHVHEDDLHEIYSLFIRILEGCQENATVAFRHRLDDGSHRLIEGTMSKMRDSDSESVVFCLRPLNNPLKRFSERKAEPAQSGEESIFTNRFLAMLSHELRTPLTPALLELGDLEEDARFIEARSSLAMIRRNLELQSRLLDEFMEFTTVVQNKIRLKMTPLDAYDVIHSVLEICRADIAASRIRVLLDLKAAEIVVVADLLRLHQVIWNLLKNAIKFSTPGGTICISAVNDAPQVFTLEVVDHGMGISQEMLQVIFDPFQQGNDSVTRRFGGLGLGLYIAKGLAEAQGGTLTAASEGPGKGAAFRLRMNTAKRPLTHNEQTS